MYKTPLRSQQKKDDALTASRPSDSCLAFTLVVFHMSRTCAEVIRVMSLIFSLPAFSRAGTALALSCFPSLFLFCRHFIGFGNYPDTSAG